MSGLIFISYRRGDDPGSVGRLFDGLQTEGFPSNQLFMDIDSIAPGIDFLREVHRQVEQSDVMLAVIGKGWLEASDAEGARRLDNPEDFVRVEIEAALRHDKRLIPVLVQDAPMPRADQLPDGMKPLALRNYVRLSHERFRLDTQVLVKALRQALDEVAVERERRAEQARLEAEEQQRQREAESAAQRALADREAEQKARQEQEEARRNRTLGLSPEQIAKAEELANWDFIKESTDPEDFRDHLARYPGGVCERWARSKLSALALSAIGPERRKEALEEYIRNFADGPHIGDAKRELAQIERDEAQAKAERRTNGYAAFRVAKDENTVAAIEAFLKAYPESESATEAALLLEGLVERDQALTKAVESGDRASLQAFLGRYPNDPEAVAVQRRLAQLDPVVPRKSRLGFKIVLAVIMLTLGSVMFAMWSQMTGPPRPSPVVSTPTPAIPPPPPTQCPSTSQSALFDLTLNAGFKPFRRAVSPGGSVRLQSCRPEMTGWVSPSPDVGLRYETSGNRTLVIEVNSKIDTILAIFDPQGAWHFNDDGAGGHNPRISFAKAVRGRYAIWVGKYSESNGNSNSQIVITER